MYLGKQVFFCFSTAHDGLCRSRKQTMKFKMGWIEKKSKYLGIWRNRWIEAYNGDKLCSFKHKSRTSPSEMIDLSYIHKAYKSNLCANEFIVAYFEDCNIKSRRFRTSTLKKQMNGQIFSIKHKEEPLVRAVIAWINK